METILLYCIIGFLIFEYLLERCLDYLDGRLWSEELPGELRTFYDADKYKKSRLYDRAKTRLGFLSSSFSLSLMLFMLISGGFARVSEEVALLTVHPVLQCLLFFGILLFSADLLGIPFSIYAVFNIETRFGFNKTTVSTFITDKLKGWMLGLILGGGLLSLVLWLYTLTGGYFWLLAWALISVFSVVMSMFYSQLIVPLFNKQKPLEEGPLRSAVQDFCARAGFRLKNIYVINGSKRSKKANAYFSGMGSKKRIVLYDTLIADHPVEELVAVLAHEIGHYKKKHTLWGMLISILNTGFLLYIFSLIIGRPEPSAALGAGSPSFHMNLLAFGMLYSPVSLLIGLVMNYFSRRNEFAADRFAAENYDPVALQSALKRLSVNNLSNLKPHRATVFFHYSHPPLLERLEALQRMAPVEPIFRN